MRKVFLIILSMILMTNVGYMGVASDFYKTYGDFTYVIEEGSISVVKYHGSEKELIIPEKINGQPVKRVGYIKTFGDFFPNDESQKVQSVIIPNGVEHIGPAVFRWCSDLKTINIPDTVTSIGYEAFYWCTSLKEITIPESVVEIDSYAFAGCESIEEITVLGSNIGANMFAGCKSLTKVNLNDKITNISQGAFYGCESLKEITIPESVTKIDHSAFRFSGLEQVIIPESVEEVEHLAFGMCPNLKEIILKNPNTKFKEDYEGGIPGQLVNMPTFLETDSLTTIYSPINSQAQQYCINNALSFVPVAKVEVNGVKVNTDVPPIISNDRVLIPARALFESLGAEIGWDEGSRTVTALTAEKSVAMQIDNPNMNVNGIVKTLDVSPKILMNRTLVPARAISESLGAKVEWDEARQTVVVTY